MPGLGTSRVSSAFDAIANAPRPSFRALTRDLLALNCAYLDHKLMDLPHDLAVKTLLLEKTCDLERPFGEKYLVIWTRIETGQPSHRSIFATDPAQVLRLSASKISR